MSLGKYALLAGTLLRGLTVVGLLFPGIIDFIFPNTVQLKIILTNFKGARVGKCETAHFCPCPPVRNWYGRVFGLVNDLSMKFPCRS